MVSSRSQLSAVSKPHFQYKIQLWVKLKLALSSNTIYCSLLIILEGESFKLHRLTGLTAYVFASLAYIFCGGLWLSTFHGGLRRRLWALTMSGWWLTEWNRWRLATCDVGVQQTIRYCGTLPWRHRCTVTPSLCWMRSRASSQTKCS